MVLVTALLSAVFLDNSGMSVFSTDARIRLENRETNEIE